jgi:hypothetical protein
MSGCFRRGWLRHYATSRKVAGSIPLWGHWIFQSTSSFQPHYGPGATQPLTEMSTRNLPGGKGGRRVKLTSPPSVSRLSKENVGASTSHTPTGLHGLFAATAVPSCLQSGTFNTIWGTTFCQALHSSGIDSSNRLKCAVKYINITKTVAGYGDGNVEAHRDVWQNDMDGTRPDPTSTSKPYSLNGMIRPVTSSD